MGKVNYLKFCWRCFQSARWRPGPGQESRFTVCWVLDKITLEERQAVARAVVEFNDLDVNDVACGIIASNVATYVTELMTTKKKPLPGFKK